MALHTVPEGADTAPAQLLRTSGGALYFRSWMLNQLVVGLLATAMPVAVVLGDRLAFDDLPLLRSSLSAYYFSALGGVFVGSLWAIGGFLIAYRIFHRSLDNLLTLVAGFCAVAVALVPTWPDRTSTATLLQQRLGQPLDQAVHSGAAILFIGLLAVMSWLFADADTGSGRSPHHRLHRGCAIAMAGAAVLAVAGWIAGVSTVLGVSSLLLVELTCTYAFGVSWFVKSAELRATWKARG